MAEQATNRSTIDKTELSAFENANIAEWAAFSTTNKAADAPTIAYTFEPALNEAKHATLSTTFINADISAHKP